MNGFQSPTYFDALALSVLAGGLLLLAGFLWILLDRREFEDPLRRRERRDDDGQTRAHDPIPGTDDAGESAPKSPKGRRRRRRAA